MLNTDPVVTFGEATFEIRKLLPTESKKLFIHNVRPLLGGALTAEIPKDSTDVSTGIKLLLAAFANAPADHYDMISRAMSHSIQVTRGSETRMLAGQEAWAFQDLEGAHAMMVDVRAFTVNFFGWWDVLTSEFPQLLTIQNQLSPPTPTLSSQPSSQPDSD